MVADNDEFETIQPATINLTQPPKAEALGADDDRKKPDRGLLLGLVVALLMALAVIFVLPELVRPVNRAPEQVTAVAEIPGPVNESPFQEAQLAEARQQAQKVLATILERKAFLEQRQVSLWAPTAFAEAVALAEQGDGLYRARQFSSALASYHRSEQALHALEQQVPALLQQTLELGLAALDAGQPGPATEQFQLALAMAPDNVEAQRGASRAASLPQVLGLVDRADQAAQTGQLEQARQLYRDALALDGENAAVQRRLDAVNANIREQNFTDAMSRGFRALNDGAAQQAITAFQAALALEPGDGAARSGLEQARNAVSQADISALLARGQNQEQREQWQAAVGSYQAIVDRDPSIIDARVGLLRAGVRAELDRALEQYLQHPQRLADGAVYQQAGKVLADARAIASPGPHLQRQIAAVSEALEVAQLPVTVILASDDRTLVTLYRIGELGTFSQRQLELRPGNYVATGSRTGYRDVRVEFQVLPGVVPKPVVIACTEPV